MGNTLNKRIAVLSSLCDLEGRMGVYNIFNCFMDMAAEHAEHIGVGYHAMLARRCYWVAVRTRVRFYDRPRIMEKIEGESWPFAPSLAKNDRFYRLTKDGRVLAEGRTEWAAQNMDTGRVMRCSEYFPEGTDFRTDKVCEEAFTRFKPLSGEYEEFFYTVSAMDIDTGRHMNNVMYIRMLLNTFSCDELKAMDITEVEVSYRRACLEGEKLSIRRASRDGEYWFDVVKPDGEIAVQAVVKTALK